MAHALVYSIAVKYDMELLKVLADRKFRNVDCCTAWKCEDFPEIVDTVFETTPDTDQGLRVAVTHICADHIDEALASEKWNAFFEENGAIGLSIFKVDRQKSKAEARMVSDALSEIALQSSSVTSRFYVDETRSLFVLILCCYISVLSSWVFLRYVI